jgi:DNA repair exonuclease SbcCD ATPase subunit
MQTKPLGISLRTYIVAGAALLLPAAGWSQSAAPVVDTVSAQAAQQAAQERLQGQIKDLESQVTRLQQEQQATYQQFQLAQEMRRNVLQQADLSANPYAHGPGIGSVPNYDDVVRMRQTQQAQIQQYSDDMNSLYGRYRELETRKQVLQDRLDGLRRQLAQSR